MSISVINLCIVLQAFVGIISGGIVESRNSVEISVLTDDGNKEVFRVAYGFYDNARVLDLKWLIEDRYGCGYDKVTLLNDGIALDNSDWLSEVIRDDKPILELKIAGNEHAFVKIITRYTDENEEEYQVSIDEYSEMKVREFKRIIADAHECLASNVELFDEKRILDDNKLLVDAIKGTKYLTVRINAPQKDMDQMDTTDDDNISESDSDGNVDDEDNEFW